MYGDKTKSKLSSFGLTDDEQIVNLISAIFGCLTYSQKGKEGVYSEIFLWIDEFEDIATLNKSTADRFTTFIRQLLDKTPNNLTIFLNVTLKTFFTIGDLSIYLGEALSSRARIKIDFEEPTINEAISYTKELINHDLFREETMKNKFYPFFNEELIKYILNHIGRRSIRKINEVFSIILELALINEKEPLIDKEFVDSIKEEIISWEDKK